MSIAFGVVKVYVLLFLRGQYYELVVYSRVFRKVYSSCILNCGSLWPAWLVAVNSHMNLVFGYPFFFIHLSTSRQAHPCWLLMPAPTPCALLHNEAIKCTIICPLNVKQEPRLLAINIYHCPSIRLICWIQTVCKHVFSESSLPLSPLPPQISLLRIEVSWKRHCDTANRIYSPFAFNTNQVIFQNGFQADSTMLLKELQAWVILSLWQIRVRTIVNLDKLGLGPSSTLTN